MTCRLVAPEGAPAEGALGMGSAPQTPAIASATTVRPASPATVISAPLKDATAATTQSLPEADDAPQAPAATYPAPTAGGNYAVNVGSFASTASADTLVASMRTAGLAAFRESGNVDGKTVQRVRVGPFATRPQAEDARLRAAKVKGAATPRVVALDAEVDAATPSKPVATAAKPVTKPATPRTVAAKPAVVASVPAASGTGFAVQLAAFSKSADANALRDKLRAAGFSAFTEAVATDKGTLTRVRVGPVLNRGEADQLKAQVKSKVGLDGVVRPHP